MKTSKLLSIALLATMMSACSQQGSMKLASNTGTGSTNAGQTVGGGDTTQNWQSVKAETDAVAEGTTYSGMQMVSIDQTRQTLNLILPLPPLVMLPISMMTFKEIPGSSLESSTLADGKNVWILAIPLKYILRNGVQLNPMGVLPNGDPIDYLPSGETNGVSLTLPQNPNHRITIYLTVGAVAAFIETPNWEFPEGWPKIWTVVNNKSKTKQIGFFEIVPNKGTFSSGVYLAAKLPADIARVLGTMVKF